MLRLLFRVSTGDAAGDNVSKKKVEMLSEVNDKK